jgi:hypothetical protein
VIERPTVEQLPGADAALEDGESERDESRAPDAIAAAMRTLSLNPAMADEVAELERLPAYLTREEAWTFLRVTERTLDRWLDQDLLVRRRVAGRTLVARASICRLILQGAGADPDDASR